MRFQLSYVRNTLLGLLRGNPSLEPLPQAISNMLHTPEVGALGVDSPGVTPE